MTEIRITETAPLEMVAPDGGDPGAGLTGMLTVALRKARILAVSRKVDPERVVVTVTVTLIGDRSGGYWGRLERKMGLRGGPG